MEAAENDLDTIQRQRDHILGMVKYKPGMTAREIELLTGIRGTHKRLPELRKLGLVESTGQKICSVSKQLVMVWKPL